MFVQKNKHIWVFSKKVILYKIFLLTWRDYSSIKKKKMITPTHIMSILFKDTYRLPFVLNAIIPEVNHMINIYGEPCILSHLNAIQLIQLGAETYLRGI